MLVVIPRRLNTKRRFMINHNSRDRDLAIGLLVHLLLVALSFLPLLTCNRPAHKGSDKKELNAEPPESDYAALFIPNRE
jgi:hypothetical protein